MNWSEIWRGVVRGVTATARWLWRALRLAYTWARRRATAGSINRQIGSKEREEGKLLLRIGRTMCVRHQAAPLQDEELSPLCQKVVALDAEVKGLRQRLEEAASSPLLPEDRGAEPLKKEGGEAATN